MSDLCMQATKTLSTFPNTCLCEAGFSALTVIKIKHCKQLQPKDDISCALLTIKPIFYKTIKPISKTHFYKTHFLQNRDASSWTRFPLKFAFVAFLNLNFGLGALLL